MPSRPMSALKILLLVCALLVGGTACIGYGNLGTLKSTVEKGNASTVQATFTLSRGELEIGGGASSLMQGEFITESRNDPAIDYAVRDRVGTLTLTQATDQTGFSMGPIQNRWSVNMNDEIPLDLTVDNGGAHVALDLDVVTMTKVSLNSAGGGASISLDGVQQALTAVELKSTGGDLNLEMTGHYAQARTIDAASMSGSITADLSGQSPANLTGSFKSTTGTITIVVPST
ncbi:MAG TPA: toast rack family protein, partial [Nitrolancea sp.]|nr:toast rack family protein [Nitrolancea sp.]